MLNGENDIRVRKIDDYKREVFFINSKFSFEIIMTNT